MANGFLVVLAADSSTDNPYFGVDRVPEYPSTENAEASAMDDYVFGDFKSLDTNLIPSFDDAVELLTRFSSSPRSFEIIFCQLDTK